MNLHFEFDEIDESYAAIKQEKKKEGSNSDSRNLAQNQTTQGNYDQNNYNGISLPKIRVLPI